MSEQRTGTKKSALVPTDTEQDNDMYERNPYTYYGNNKKRQNGKKHQKQFSYGAKMTKYHETR
jgi:hypothetical protein